MDKTYRQRIEHALAGSISEKERKALSRLLKLGAMEDFLDRETERLLSTEPTEGLDSERLAGIKAYIKDYEEKIIPMPKPTWTRAWAAVAAVAMIGITVGMLLYRPYYSQREALTQDESFVTKTNGEYVQIPDGSSALLDAGSSLIILPNFGKDTREVALKGKAYFDVNHDASKPFIVRTGRIVTTVLGTAFYIDTHSNKDQITIAVTRGKVTVGDGNKVYDNLTRDQQLTVNTFDYSFEKKTVDPEKVTVWKANYLILDGVTMARAVELIAERFKVNVLIENDQVKQCVISAWFVNNENLNAVMTVLSKLTQATYTINGNKVIVKGGTGCP